MKILTTDIKPKKARQGMNNNYITLINRFWDIFAEEPLQTADTALYFFLLNACNKQRWKQPFARSDQHLAIMLGVTVPTVRKAKDRLVKRGLIAYTSPDKASRGEEGRTRYYFPGFESVPEISGRKVGNTKKPLQLPFGSPQFAESWGMLLETPRWKKKTPHALSLALSKLGGFDEEFAILLIGQAMAGGWQRLVFPETERKYQQWKNNKEYGKRFQTTADGSDAGSRKAEIVRRAAVAVAACGG